MSLRSGMWAVCFTDLVGSTEQRARLGDDAGDGFRREHDEIVARAAHEHGGTLVKGTGDGALVAFPAAAAAVDAAVAIQQAIDRRNQRADEPLALRVGISAGDLVNEADDLHGLAANEAARLCALAPPGQILLSDLAAAVGGSRIRHELSARGALELRGIPEPVVTWEVEWEPAADPAGPPFPALLTSQRAMAFSGRTEELGRLTAAWKQASRGSLSSVLLSGEPGIGKTRLAAEMSQRAHREGALVLVGRCDEGLGVPFQPFAEALSWYCEHTPAPSLGKHPEDLVRISDHVARLTPDARQPLRDDPETEQLRLFDAVLSWLTDCASAQPVLLVLDDLHWATRPTLQMLRHILSYGSDVRLLVIGTYRDTDVDRAHSLTPILAELWRRPGVERLAIDGLDHTETVELLERVGERAADDDTVALAAALLTETEGNPFFIGEVLRNLVESGGLVRRDGTWTSPLSISDLGIPEGIRYVLRARLDRLGSPTAEVLQCAAVVGREFDVEVVTNAADADEHLVLDSVEAALSSRLIEEAGTDRFRFSHALVRQTLYDDISTSRRVRLHRRIAHHLEDTGRASAVELAYQFGQSATLGEAERAVHWLERAGCEAIQRLAFDEAIEFFGRALDAEELFDPRDPARRADLLLARGDARNRAAEPGPARADFLDAAALARAARRPDLLAAAARGYGGAGGALMDPTDSVGSALTTEALAALEPGDSPMRCRLLLRRCMWLMLNPDPAERQKVSKEAIAMARRLGDPETLLAALSEQATGLRGQNQPDEQLAIADEMSALARQVGSVIGECNAYECRTSASAKLGDLDGMWDTASRLRGRAAEIRSAERQWSAAANLAIVAILRGAFDQAVELIAEEARFAPAYGVVGEMTIGLQQHLMTLARGDTAACAALLRELCDSYPILTAVYPAPVDIARWEGRLDDCRVELESWWQNVLPFLPAQFRAYTFCSMAQSATAVGALEIVEAIRRELIPRAGTWTGSPCELTFYCVDHSLAWCALAMDDEDTGEQHLRDALAFYDRAGTPVLVAHAVADLAELGRAERALLDRAIQIADEKALDEIAGRLGSTTV